MPAYLPLILPGRVLKYVDQFLIAAVLVAFFSLSSAQAQTENEGENYGAPRLITPDEATSGALLLKTNEPGRFLEAPRLTTDVSIVVSGPIARTRVTQRFENISDLWVEGVYVFPLPDESAVDTLKIQIGDRFIEGRIEEKKKAKEIYEAAKREGKKASLLEQERPNIFTNSVANIGPGETIIVQIEYQENVKLEDHQFSLRFPMVVAPRFNPPAIIHNVSFDANADQGAGWGAIDPVPDRDRIEPPVLHPDAGPANPVTLSVDINAGFPLGEVSSSYHPVTIHRPEAHRASLVLSDETTPANRDFELIWKPKSGTAPSVALFTETIDATPYYLVMLTPPSGSADAISRAREVTFVIDTSGSMGGQSIKQARESLKLAVKRLKPGDAFNIIQFNSEMHQLFAAPRRVDEASISTALRYVASLDAGGGTMMLPALEAALVDHNLSKDHLRQVVFITDGSIGNEEQLFTAISSRRGDARIFTIGIGSAPNSYFMSRAAELGQGAFTHIGATSEVAERMNALFTKLETPAVTDLRIDWPNSFQIETWPSPIPDLYQGETLVVAARAEGKRGKIKVSGINGDTPWQVNIPIRNAAERTGISKLWARKKIASLELNRARGASGREEIDQSILKVALRHGLISRLTSLVAVETTPTRPQGEGLTRTDVPLNLPQGWDFDKVYGETIRPLQREAYATQMRSGRLASNAIGNAAPALAAQSTNSVVLPQGATLADAKLIYGGVLLILTLIFLFLANRPHLAFLPAGAKRVTR